MPKRFCLPSSHFAIVLCLLLLAESTFAQESLQTLSFATGSSNPVGTFARSKSVADRGADLGTMGEISYQWRPVKSSFGFVASARFLFTPELNNYPGYTSDGTTPVIYGNGGQMSVPQKTTVRIDDPNNYPGYKTHLHQAMLETGAAFAGVTHYFRFAKRWSVREQLQLGIARMSQGVSTLKGSRPDTAQAGSDDLIYSEWTTNPGMGITGLILVAPCFRLNESVEFYLSADYWYLHTKMTYFSTTRYSTAPAGTEPGSVNGNLQTNGLSEAIQTPVKKNPSMINILFGIRVALKGSRV